MGAAIAYVKHPFSEAGSTRSLAVPRGGHMDLVRAVPMTEVGLDWNTREWEARCFRNIGFGGQGTAHGLKRPR